MRSYLHEWEALPQTGTCRNGALLATSENTEETMRGTPIKKAMTKLRYMNRAIEVSPEAKAMIEQQALTKVKVKLKSRKIEVPDEIEERSRQLRRSRGKL